MGSFLDEIKNSKKQLEISRRLKMQAHIDWIKHDISTDIEKEKKVKEQYSILVRNLNSSIKIMGEKLQKELDKLDDYGRFPVSVIGPLIAKAMTEIEGQKFIYKEVNFREIYDYYDEEDFPRRGKVCIVTNRLDNFDISESYEDVGNFAKGGKTILLGTIGFDMGYYIYNGNKYEVQQIVDSDDKVAFYSPKYDIATKDYNYIDEYIDLLIERKVLNESYLDDLDGYSFEIRDYMNFRTELLEEKDYQELYDYIINKHKKFDKMSLKREKND